jgi:uncharacterized protein
MEQAKKASWLTRRFRRNRNGKRKDEFQTLLAELAGELAQAADLLIQVVPGEEDLCLLEKQIKSHEHRGDEIIRTLIDRLNQSFITPYDREDLHQLAETMDDVLDGILSCTSKTFLYRVEEPIEGFAELSVILRKQVILLVEAINNLGDTQVVLQNCRLVNDLENEGDQLYHHIIRNLFERECNAIRLLKNKEIIEDLEAATDACEDVADSLESIAVKYS